MADCFKGKYARFYDLIYKDKDYRKECGYLENIFKAYAPKRPRTVLDLACGTAGHIIPLAKRGYEVCGNDISPAMIKIAKNKTRSQGLKIKFYCNSIQDLKVGRKFDCAIGMFSCIDYIISLRQLMRTLGNIRACLSAQGLFTFDFWNKDCVLKNYSPLKKKTVKRGNIQVTRISQTTLDRKNSLAKVRFNVFCFKDGLEVSSTQELHRMKYYRLREMTDILESCGFKVLAAFPFMQPGKKVTARDWNISVVAVPVFSESHGA